MKILLADDHPLVREGVRQVLAQLEPPVEILDAHDYPSLFARAARHSDLDLALVDLNMPGFAGTQGITQFCSRFPDIPLMVLSASESPHDVHHALEAGALGYIPKAASTAVMLAAVRQVLSGGIYVPTGLSGLHPVGPPGFGALQHSGLTVRQLEVARLLAQGCANKTIADMLAMSESTVKVHIAAIFRVFNASNRTEAVLAIQRLPHAP
ncbi:response regulator transcription factor [Thiobacillus denitrificans]|uniref:response regulator transcription factor n=1 Tax=Thiobacillus denitrificans TaxID=36861 RepID=UPI00038116DC|nr:response regulator transcription factor [Thiobacillus denitrificans]